MVAAPPRSRSDGLFSIAVFLALALHVILILGLGFTAGEGNYHPPQLEVTLAQIRGEQAPSEADHLAPQHQQGSGDQSERSQLSGGSPLQAQPGQPDSHVEQDLSEQADRQVLQTRRSELRHEQTTDSLTARQASSVERQGLATRLLPFAATASEAPADNVLQETSRAPRIRQITALSARAAEDAAYLHAWEQRVESVGNRYYPEASIRYGIYGSLRLLVAVDRLGQLVEVRVLDTSGHAVLDEAAIKIVRMAAPFAPFPAALAATTDRLEIVRTWHFQENRLSSG